MKNNNAVVVERINDAVQRLKNRDFTFYFFVVDSKGVPNGSLTYIYNTAKVLHDKGYKVQMLYQIEDEYTQSEIRQKNKKNEYIDPSKVFTGVGDWLGAEYANLPHLNVSTEEFKVGAYDFLFIPEAFASLMYQTYKYNAPCRRIVILQNYNYTMDFLPMGVEWRDYGIREVVATSKVQSDLIESVFPYVKAKVVRPMISKRFRKPITAKNLIVNIVAKNQDLANRVVKPFFWKYPIFKFVTFRDLRNFPQETFAEKLQEGIATIWLDEDTPFGYSALESMACDSVVIGKIPETLPEWLVDEKKDIRQNGFWTYDINQIPDIVAKFVNAWMRNEVPQEIYDNMLETCETYNIESFKENVVNTYEKFVDEQIEMLNEVLATVNKDKKSDEE